jgi:hypothetical protein
MSWDRPLRVLVTAAAIAALAACGGGGASGSMPSAGAASNNTLPAPPKELEVTQAPTSRIQQIDAAKERDDINLGQWIYEEPLAVTASETLTNVSFERCTAQPTPLFGFWYLALMSYTVNQQPITIPACSLTKGQSASNFYIVEVAVSLSGVVVTPLTNPAIVDGNGEWTFNADQKVYDFAADSLYTFWVAQSTTPASTPTPSPTPTPSGGTDPGSV